MGVSVDETDRRREHEKEAKFAEQIICAQESTHAEIFFASAPIYAGRCRVSVFQIWVSVAFVFSSSTAFDFTGPSRESNGGRSRFA